MVGTGGGIAIAVVVLALVALVGWVVFTQMRARRLGLPPPSFKSYIPFAGSSRGGGGGGGGGIKGWFNGLRNSRSSAGAYEQPLQGGAGRRGFGPLDPDEAWDSRVGHEADTYGPYGGYEEQELGGTGGSGYSGAAGVRGGADTYDMNVPGGPTGGDSRGRQPGGRNPFEDDAEPSNISMRGVSPRPLDTGAAGAQRGPSQAESPTERRSMFRENV